MAIVNVTPDSFYGASRTEAADAIARRVDAAVAEGAAILDVGGCSSRPGAVEVSETEEYDRLARALEVIRRRHPQVPVSVDTFRSGVVRRVVDAFGPVTVNDIAAGNLDDRMLGTVAELGLPYIAMHMRGTPATMQQLTGYTDVAAEVEACFVDLLERCDRLGMRERVVLDPGFGFAKTVGQNYALLGSLHRLCALGRPVLAGLSRKSMIWKPLRTDPEGALAGTVALNWEALRQGARILRVHDVREAVDTVRLFTLFSETQTNGQS